MCKGAEPLIPAVSHRGVNCYTQQAFGQLKEQELLQTGTTFKRKHLGLIGGQLVMDEGVTIKQVSRSIGRASTLTMSGNAALPGRPRVREGQ